MKKISVLIPCYNEEENAAGICQAVLEQLAKLESYDYEIIFIDNNSTDKTRVIIEDVCKNNKKVKAIFNAKNFGQFSSPYYGLMQSSGDCVIPICADFQDPVEMIPVFVKEWESGYKIVAATKKKSKTNPLVHFFRGIYYKFMKKHSDYQLIEQFTGFALYDKSFIDVLRNLDEPQPFIRGIVAELGADIKEVPYVQAKRRAGKTKNNFGTLYDAAMLSVTAYTKFPVRLIMFLGVFFGFLGFCGGIACLILDLLNIWKNSAALIFCIVMFFAGFQLVSTAAVGEYILTLTKRSKKRPLVVEERRINFD